jgi:hypothetical protein
VNRFVRWLLPGLGAKVSKEQAAEIARKECTARGLTWLEPVRVFRHYGNWSVWTNADKIGGNIRIIIDSGNGQVVSLSGPTPR